ncbi:Importin-7 [Fragariocoptes setiger]|uniref:Importin-7 n=1 Tax=Fragariocoptes setiger TaxID=1670756 RepID=A0ABQ7SD33_9ACAR|nr:Importin-7 [Fragariocoptes setiger]
MDYNKIIDLLRKSLDPDANVRGSAEKNLEQIHKIISFAPTLMRAVLDQALELHIRQAAAIYLKNEVVKYWEDPTQAVQSDEHCVLNGTTNQQQPGAQSSILGNHSTGDGEQQFTIHEQDKQILRDSIVDALVSTQNHVAKDVLAVHLTNVVYQMIKNDFPHRWSNVCDKILMYLQANDPLAWNAALVTLLQMAKVFEYKPLADRQPFLDAMQIILPVVYQRIAQLVQSDPLSERSCRLQKVILKIFHAFVQYSFPLALLNREVFIQWMQIIIEITKSDVPDSVQQDVDTDERPELIWWKCKKWCLHILSRIFERYGSPGHVSKEYKEFADWYLKNFSAVVIQTCLKSILEPYAQGRYIAPRVMQLTLNYLNTSVLHSLTWKMLKDDMLAVVEKIIFPLMCYSEEDEELWTNDPREYIRLKFDAFEEYVSPVMAAQTLFHECCKKRRDMLDKSMLSILRVLNNPQADPKHKDGALHLIGSIADVLLRKKKYKSDLEQLLVTYVFPLFSCNLGFLRARSFWVLNHFSEITFKQESNLMIATQAILNGLMSERELPVRVEAAICLQSFIECQEKVTELVKPTVTQVALQLVDIVVHTHNEDVMSVTQRIVCLYPDEIYVIAVKLTTDLALTFEKLITESEDDAEENTLSAMAILNTIDTILTMLDEQKQIVVQLESIVIKVILTIFERSLSELYEEATTLLSTITTDSVSPESWTVFPVLYNVFKRDGYDYFTDMMSPIHNYITVDPQTFISNRDNLRAIYEMCSTILRDPNAGEEIETYAAKLIEIVILQFKNQIDDCIPSFIELAVSRLGREIATTELRTLLLQIMIAALYYNYELLFQTLEKMQPKQGIAMFSSFVHRWMTDVNEFLGLHDRKMCMIGLCILAMLPPQWRPPVVVEYSTHIVPFILSMFDKLKLAYQKKAAADSDSDSDDEDDLSDTDEAEALDDDQDHVSVNDDDDNEGIGDDEYDPNDYESYTESDDDCEPTALESFETILDTEKAPVDEFVMFRETLEIISKSDPAWYQVLVANLDAENQKKLREISDFAIRRAAEAESKRIQSQGGYSFRSQDVPATFNFTDGTASSKPNNGSATR